MTKPTPEPIDPDKLVELALAVIAKDRFPQLATIDGDQPRLRPVSPVRTDGFVVYVANLRFYAKTAQIQANPKVELCYLDERHDQVRITAVAELLTDRPLLQEIWDANPLMQQYLGSLDNPELMVYRMVPKQVRFMREWALVFSANSSACRLPGFPGVAIRFCLSRWSGSRQKTMNLSSPRMSLVPGVSFVYLRLPKSSFDSRDTHALIIITLLESAPPHDRAQQSVKKKLQILVHRKYDADPAQKLRLSLCAMQTKMADSHDAALEVAEIVTAQQQNTANPPDFSLAALKYWPPSFSCGNLDVPYYSRTA